MDGKAKKKKPRQAGVSYEYNGLGKLFFLPVANNFLNIFKLFPQGLDIRMRRYSESAQSFANTLIKDAFQLAQRIVCFFFNALNLVFNRFKLFLDNASGFVFDLFAFFYEFVKKLTSIFFGLIVGAKANQIWRAESLILSDSGLFSASECLFSSVIPSLIANA